MRVARYLFALLALVPVAASAQPSAPGSPAAQATRMTPLEVQAACGPPTSLDVPSSPLHVIGSQDPVSRFVFGTGELLVLDGGSAKGVQLGQQYVIHRPMIAGVDRKHVSAVLTLGWLSVVGLNEQTAIAKVDH